MALPKSIVDSWFEQQQSLSDLTHNVIYQRLEEVVLRIKKLQYSIERKLSKEELELISFK